MKTEVCEGGGSPRRRTQNTGKLRAGGAARPRPENAKNHQKSKREVLTHAVHPGIFAHAPHLPPLFAQSRAGRRAARSAGSRAHRQLRVQPADAEIRAGAEAPAAGGRAERLVHWAAYLPPEQGAPGPGETPTAFIAVFQDEDLPGVNDTDAGLALGSLTAAAWAHGVASCIMGNIDRAPIKTLLGPGRAQPPAPAQRGGAGLPRAGKPHRPDGKRQRAVLSGRKPGSLRAQARDGGYPGRGPVSRNAAFSAFRPAVQPQTKRSRSPGLRPSKKLKNVAVGGHAPTTATPTGKFYGKLCARSA